MNFITYINQFGSFKTALVNYDPVASIIETQNAINEDYLVTSVFVEGVKRLVHIDNAVQLAVINDNNFDGNILDLNHYNVEGTYFAAKLIPLDTGVVVGSGVSDVLPFRSPRSTYIPVLFSEANKLNDGIVYFDLTIWKNSSYQEVVLHSYYDAILKKSIPNEMYFYPSLSKGSYVLYYGLNVSISNQTSFTPTIANTVTLRTYFNVLTNCFSIAVSDGALFDPENSRTNFDFYTSPTMTYFIDKSGFNRFIYNVGY